MTEKIFLSLLISYTRAHKLCGRVLRTYIGGGGADRTAMRFTPCCPWSWRVFVVGRGVGGVGRRCYSSRSGSVSEEELNKLSQQLECLPDSRAALEVGGASRDGGKRSLALLVGWTSSSLRAVVKHAAPYTEVGIPALCVAPSLLQVWSSTLSANLTRSLLVSLDRSLAEPASLVLHMFSAAAGVVLPTLVADLESSERRLTGKLNPAAAVFDSGPTSFSYEAGMAGGRLAYQQGGYSYPVYLAAVCGGVAFNAAMGRRKRREVDSALRSPLLDLPQLYLHSEADLVATVSRVRKVMLDQQAVGREVHSHCWEDTQHVRHYLADPVTYTHHIHSLLNKCQLI